MSTKIYNGYRLRQGYSIFDFRAKFATVMRNEVKRAQLARLTSSVILFMDDIDCKDKAATKTLRDYLKKVGAASLTVKMRKETPTLVKNVFNCTSYKERIEKFSQKVDPFESQDNCSMTIVHNSIRNETYILFYGSRSLERLFTAFPEVEEFGYWDNSDFPENMTEEEWEDRGKAWKEAADLDNSMSSQGFVVNPFDPYNQFVSKKGYEDYLTSSNGATFPTKEDRLSIMVRKTLITEYAEKTHAKGEQFMLGDMNEYIRDQVNVRNAEKNIAPKLRDITFNEYTTYLLMQ
jgi:hypothetical protein